MIAHSEVYINVNGRLIVEVTQKKALARVMSSNGSYYLDDKANKMPLSDQFSAHVPVVYSELKESNKEIFAQLLNTIHNDEFLKRSEERRVGKECGSRC